MIYNQEELFLHWIQAHYLCRMPFFVLPSVFGVLVLATICFVARYVPLCFLLQLVIHFSILEHNMYISSVYISSCLAVTCYFFQNTTCILADMWMYIRSICVFVFLADYH